MKSTVASAKSGLTAKKPAMGTKVMTTPKAIPASGSAMIAPASPTAGEMNDGDESWSVTEADEIDLDGDSDGDAADVLLDDESGDTYVWWSGTADMNGDGGDEAYDGFAVIQSQGGVLFIIDVGAGGSLACASEASGESGCVVCDSGGQCAEVGEDADYDDEETAEEGDSLFDASLETGDT